MVHTNDILTYASTRPNFTVGDLWVHLSSSGNKCTPNAVSCKLRRLVADGMIKRVERGLFSIEKQIKNHFIPFYDEEMAAIAKEMHQHYPLLPICIWHIDDLRRMSHYVTNHNIIYVEVDRDAIEGVFSKLSDSITSRRVFINPSEDDYVHYIVGVPSIVVKPLVSEAPVLRQTDGSLRTTLEKILVDAVIDKDFIVWHDFESLRLYNTAFERYEINISRLLRYAQRRGKKKMIMDIINDRDKIYD